MDLISRAIIFAVNAHSGAFRKGDKLPSVLHAVEAATIAASITSDHEIIAAAALHDTAEDAGIALDKLRQEFGDRVAELVASETENKRRDVPSDKSWRVRKEEAIKQLSKTDDIGVKIIFLSDKLSNMRSFYRQKVKDGDSMWEVYNNKNPEDHHWYYRTIADNLSELSDTSAYIEYNKLIGFVFDEGEEKSV